MEDIYGSGNVFADLGLSNPEERLAKAEIAVEIGKVIKLRQLTQEQAAEIAGIPQPKISAIVRGKLEDISLDRLYRVLNGLGVNISVVLTPQPEWTKGNTMVVERDALTGRAPAVAAADHTETASYGMR